MKGRYGALLEVMAYFYNAALWIYVQARVNWHSSWPSNICLVMWSIMGMIAFCRLDKSVNQARMLGDAVIPKKTASCAKCASTFGILL